MDPLVRAALVVQQALARSSGTLLGAGFGAYLVGVQRLPELSGFQGVVGAAFAASLALRIFRRLRRLNAAEALRLDLELFTHLVVLAYGGILAVPAALQPAVYPLIYGLMMLSAAFARPAAAIGTLLFALGLEAAFTLFLQARPAQFFVHAGLLALFTFLNLLVFRSEIARVRRLSRARIENEIQKMKDAARSYRLLGAPSTGGDRVSLHGAPHSDEERLLRSGVEEINAALKFALDLLRRSLGLKTAVLLWLDAAGTKLRIQELSTQEDGIFPGPFGARDGIFAACMARGEPIGLTGPKAAQHVPHYAQHTSVGAVCAVPVIDHGHPRGVLLVDREAREPFTTREEELLLEATRFALRAIENERVFVQLERAKHEQGKLYRAAEALAAATTEASVIEAGVNSAREFASFDFAAVTLFDRSSGEHEICAVSGEEAKELVGQRYRHNAGLVSMVVANRHPLPYRGDYDPARQMVFTRRLAPPKMPSLLVLPLLVHERALGTIVLGSKRKASFGDAVRPTLEVLASHIAVSLANARMLKRLEEMATTDGLTGLFNKRALTEVAGQKLRSALRFKKPLSVLITDIDHFKKVNDTYGHDVGDVVIRGFAAVLKRAKRDTDVVGRFGGEEFVIVCEETDARGAELLAERIRSELEQTVFPSELGPLRVTCSLGVATCPAAGQTWESLFKATDEALYASKRGGRNRVTVWSPKLSGAAA